MSSRTHRMRKLATSLTHSTGVHVILRYERAQNGYRVEWAGGPDADRMREITAEFGDDIDLTTLTWHRAADEPERR